MTRIERATARSAVSLPAPRDDAPVAFAEESFGRGGGVGCLAEHAVQVGICLCRTCRRAMWLRTGEFFDRIYAADVTDIRGGRRPSESTGQPWPEVSTCFSVVSPDLNPW